MRLRHKHFVAFPGLPGSMRKWGSGDPDGLRHRQNARHPGAC